MSARGSCWVDAEVIKALDQFDREAEAAYAQLEREVAEARNRYNQHICAVHDRLFAPIFGIGPEVRH